MNTRTKRGQTIIANLFFILALLCGMLFWQNIANPFLSFIFVVAFIVNLACGGVTAQNIRRNWS